MQPKMGKMDIDYQVCVCVCLCVLDAVCIKLHSIRVPTHMCVYLTQHVLDYFPLVCLQRTQECFLRLLPIGVLTKHTGVLP